MAERRYDDKELAAILRAAAEAQAQDETASDKLGLTLSEIERLASEVGIDPKHVSVVAARLDSEPEARRTYAAGAPTNDMVERTIDGEIDEPAWEEAVSDFRRTFGCVGDVAVVGATREWGGGTDMLNANVSVSARGGQTRVRLSLSQLGGIVIYWMVGFMAWFFCSLILALSFARVHMGGAPVLILVAAAIAFFTSRGQISKWSGYNRAKSNALLDRLAELAVSPAQPVSSSPAIEEPNNLKHRA